MSATSPSSASATGNGPGDLLLVQAALRGEGAAVESLLARLACIPRFVYRLNRLLGNGLPVDALEDVVQQVYAVLWPRLRDFHGRNPLETWVFGFCRNCLRSASRRRHPRAAGSIGAAGDDLLATLAAPGLEEPGHGLETFELLAVLHEEIDDLPAEERDVVRARHFDGNSFEDLARQSGVAVSTIKDRCYRAMQRLQRRLARRVGGERP